MNPEFSLRASYFLSVPSLGLKLQAQTPLFSSNYPNPQGSTVHSSYLIHLMLQSSLINTELPREHGRGRGFKFKHWEISWQCVQENLQKGHTEGKTIRPLQDLSGYERTRSRTKMGSIKMERMVPLVGRLYWPPSAKCVAVICLPIHGTEHEYQV